MTTKELLEKSAKAAGIEVFFNELGFCQVSSNVPSAGPQFWNPLEDDGDAFRLMCKCNMDVRYDMCDQGLIVYVSADWDDAPPTVSEIFDDGTKPATRLAITRYAAAIAEGRE